MNHFNVVATTVSFPPEWGRAALLLNLLSACIVVGVFTYLNQARREERSRLWTVAWVFYAVALVATLEMEESDVPLLLLLRLAGLGISAAFFFWGSLAVGGSGRPARELGGGIVLLVAWSFVAVYRVQEPLSITAPVFLLLGGASIFSGVRQWPSRHRHRGARMLGMGFLLWGLHLGGLPFLETQPLGRAVLLVAGAVLTWVIALGMLLEQERTFSERDYHALFDSAADAIVLFDALSLRVVAANRAAQALFGLWPPDWGRQDFAGVLPDFAGRPGRVATADTFAETLNNMPREVRLSLPNHGERVCEIRASRVHCPQGGVLQVNVRDVTTRHRAEQELSVKSAVLVAETKCIIISDRQGRIEWVNPAFTELTGYTAKEAVGQHAWFVNSDDHPASLYRELWDSIASHRAWSGEVLNRRKDGRHYREYMTIVPIRNAAGVVTNFVTTKQKLADMQPVSAGGAAPVALAVCAP
ncbi:MAG: hypothetical protein PCFJNLEI_03059 [Verrucomicrobiae bacterium]|nr:hypothetical protein [Verrucomicrobiae bacterium]